MAMFSWCGVMLRLGLSLRRAWRLCQQRHKVCAMCFAVKSVIKAMPPHGIHKHPKHPIHKHPPTRAPPLPHLQNLKVTRRCSIMGRGGAVILVQAPRLCPSRQQRSHCLVMAVEGCQVQRCVAIWAWQVDVQVRVGLQDL